MKIVEDKWPTKQLKQTQQQQISINNTTTSATTINSNSNNIITATSKESFPPSLTTSNQSHPTAETTTTMSTQMNGIQAENYIPSFQYDNQTAQGQMHHQQMTVHVGNNHNHEMFIPVKQEITSTPNFSRPPQSKFESYVSMSAPVTPSTPRNESPSQTPNTAPPDRKIDNRPAFSSFHSSPYPSQTHRKRRDNTVGFPQDAGPFFTQTQQHYPLYTIDRSTNLKVRINSKVDRGFFLADNDWTCYRRNYFQISSAFSISGTPHPVNESDVSCLIEVDGQYYAVTQFLLGITARVSNSDKKIELVQHTPKRDKGPQMVPGPKPIRPGGNLNLSSVGTNSNIVTFERIQFKTATANNGKRRAAQQYYVLMVDLYAQVETGEPYRLATTTSAPLVVRGRSPGHYADNHERYNPIQMHPAFPNDGRHMSFTGPNGTPGMMPGDFNGPFSSPYGQYPPPFQGFPGSLMMATGPPNSTHAPFHPQHPPQHYMVQNMQETGDNPNPEMFNNGNIHPNNMEEGSNPPTDSLPGGSKPFMKIEIPPQSSHIPDHPLTSPAYHSQEFVEGLHLYNGNHNNGQPANAAATHNGGYHSDSEQHRGNNNNNNNGFNKRQDIISQQSSNTQQNNSATSNNNNSASTTISSSSPSSTNHSASTPATTTATVNNPSTTTTTTNSELNDEKTNDTNSNDVGNKNPSKIIDENSNNSTTTPTTELGKSLGQMTMDQKSCEQ